MAALISKEIELEVRPLAATVGAEVYGVPWETPSEELVFALNVALRRHLLLVFRGQPVASHEQLDAFFRPFGRLVAELGGTEFYSALATGEDKSYGPMAHDRDGRVYVSSEDARGSKDLIWHNDQAYQSYVKKMSGLEGIDCNSDGTPTLFRDMYTAYETLPSRIREHLEFKLGIYPNVVRPSQPAAMHLIFSPHPDSRRRALYVSERGPACIAGTSQEESDELLQLLREHAQRAAPVYAHHWQIGDFVVWDNVGLQHRRDKLPAGERRVLRVYEGVGE